MEERDIALFLFICSIFMVTLTFYDKNVLSKTIFGSIMCVTGIYLARKAFKKDVKVETCKEEQ